MRFTKVLPALFVCVLAAVFASPANAYAPFEMGIHDPNAAEGDPATFDRLRAAGPRIVRITRPWRNIAPNAAQKPAGMDARNPSDPNYDWTSLDKFVRAAAARGLEPLVTSYLAPDWAEGYDAEDRANRIGNPGTYRPNGRDYGDFMHAMATRYNGSFPDPLNPGKSLPRVRYYQAWNEQNFGQYLRAPRKSDIPVAYVNLLNGAYDAVKGVNKSNLVLTGGLGPHGNNGFASDVNPQTFMRSMMCLSGKGGRKLKRKRGCKVPKPKFDVWTQHPYTFGGKPTSKAGNPDGAALGNMADVKRTLDYAVRKRAVLPRGRKKLWATEFAWFSNPPGIRAGNGQQLGLPLSRQAAYLSETAYRLWRLRFEALIWYGLTDYSQFPSGLTFSDNKPKPALDAFKLPFYADHGSRGVLVWGKVSGATGKTRVRVEKRSGRKWRHVDDVRTDARGLFYRRLRGSRGVYRARAVSGDKRGTAAKAFRAR